MRLECVRQYDCMLKKFDRVPLTPPPTYTQPCISVHLTESRNYLLHSCDGQHCSETTALEMAIIPTGHVMTEHLEGSHTMRTHMNTNVQTNTHTPTHTFYSRVPVRSYNNIFLLRKSAIA